MRDRVEQVEEFSKAMDFSIYGISRIRVRYVNPTKKRGGHYRIRCGDCSKNFDIYPAHKDEGLDPMVEICGVIGTQANWRDILLPILGMSMNKKAKK
jgi:hypothetical protein